MKPKIERITAVIDQAHDLMTSVAAVKGEDFARLVKIMLTGLSVSHVQQATLDMADDIPQDVKAHLVDVHTAMLGRVLDEVAAMLEVPPNVMSEVLYEADRINTTVTALMAKAVTAADFG